MSHHGCMLKNADGTKKITGTEKCITPTDECLWKYPNDMRNRVKTRSDAKNELTVDYKEVDNYFAVKYFIHQWIMGKEDRFFCKIKFIRQYIMFKYIYKAVFIFYLVTHLCSR